MALRKLLTLALALILVFALSGCGNGEEEIPQEEEELNGEAGIEEGADPSDASGPVAIINGEEIPRAEFELRMQEMMAMYGMPEGAEEDEETAAMKEMMQEQVLQELITRALLMQQVEDENIQVEESTVEEEFEQFQEEYGGEEAFAELLDQEGYTPENFKEAIAEEMAISQYLDSYVEDTLGSEALEPDEEELKSIYNQYKDQMGEEAPDFEEVKGELKEVFQQEQVQQVTGKLLNELMEESEVEILL